MKQQNRRVLIRCQQGQFLTATQTNHHNVKNLNWWIHTYMVMTWLSSGLSFKPSSKMYLYYTQWSGSQTQLSSLLYIQMHNCKKSLHISSVIVPVYLKIYVYTPLRSLSTTEVKIKLRRNNFVLCCHQNNRAGLAVLNFSLVTSSVVIYDEKRCVLLTWGTAQDDSKADVSRAHACIINICS